jgi:hypothetical protein
MAESILSASLMLKLATLNRVVEACLSSEGGGANAPSNLGEEGFSRLIAGAQEASASIAAATNKILVTWNA